MPEFDEHGRTIEGTEEEIEDTPPVDDETDETDETEGDEPADDESSEEVEGEEPPKPAGKGKYRIGDKYFNTEAEALAYANANEAPQTDRLDAYRQGLLDAAALKNPDGSVTPPEDDGGVPFDEEAYLADPAGYMRKRDQLLIAKAAETVNNQSAIREQGNAIWNEFAGRHPELAGFRDETETFVSQNKDEIQAMIRSKGRPAAFDFIALRLKANFRKYQMLGKPTRTLPNGGGGPSPTGTGRSVTPKAKPEKVLSFAEQIRQRRVR